MSDYNLSGVWSHLSDKKAIKGRGAYIYTDDGEKILDFTSGIGVNSTGHCHPLVVDAIKNQSEELIFSQINCIRHNKVFELTEKLETLLPEELNKFFFAQSGAEAVEAAVKLAKHATGRSGIIVMQGSFHGRTHMTMAMTTSKTIYRKSYNNLPSGVYVTPFPYSFKSGLDEKTEVENALKSLETILDTQCAPDETAAIFIEPVLGEGGYIPTPTEYLKGIRRLCNKYGILMVADEVQTGFGRTGKMFAIEHSGVIPDILIMAKGLGSGVPISGIAYKEEFDDKWIKGSHGGTYGASPIGCAAALGTIEAIQSDNLVENSEIMGKQLMGEIKSLQKKFPCIGDVRGLGLMIGIEFMNGADPDVEAPKKISELAMKQNLLLLTCGIRKNVLRLIPPLIITENEIKESIKIISDVMRDIYDN